MILRIVLQIKISRIVTLVGAPVDILDQFLAGDEKKQTGRLAEAVNAVKDRPVKLLHSDMVGRYPRQRQAAVIVRDEQRCRRNAAEKQPPQRTVCLCPFDLPGERQKAAPDQLKYQHGQIQQDTDPQGGADDPLTSFKGTF